MSGYGFKDRSIALYLKERAQAGIPSLSSKEDPDTPGNHIPSSKLLLGYADGTIPGATLLDSGEWELGEGYIYLVSRDDTGEYLSTEYPENTPESALLIQLRNSMQAQVQEDTATYLYNCERVRVWNPRPEPINVENLTGCLRCPFKCGHELLIVSESAYGDLIIMDSITGATTTTSTTSFEPLENYCISTNCRFTWSPSTQSWIPDEAQSCTASSTTTTSTTSGDCICPVGGIPSNDGDLELQNETSLGLNGEGNLELQDSSTETPNSTCNCTWPTFCGQVDGECVNTECSTVLSEPPECSTTSTSTTSTTSCDCNCATSTTSTTSDSGCSLGCDWVYTMFGYIRTSNGCSPSCPCSRPTGAAEDCEEFHTDCVPLPDIPLPPPSCSGRCAWYWFPGATTWTYIPFEPCFTTGTWDSMGGTCGCTCAPPARDGEDCEYVITDCGCQNTNTSSTSSTSSTSHDPCACCYSTTTSTTTTSTTSACSGYCEWKSTLELAWDRREDPCLPSCPCPEPSVPPTETCESKTTPCIQGTTTTTSTTSTSTTTTSTTTPGWICRQWQPDYPTAPNCETGDLLGCGPVRFDLYPGVGYDDSIYYQCGPIYSSLELCTAGCVEGTTSTTTTSTTSVFEQWWCINNGTTVGGLCVEPCSTAPKYCGKLPSTLDPTTTNCICGGPWPSVIVSGTDTGQTICLSECTTTSTTSTTSV